MEKTDLKIFRGYFSVLYSTFYLTRIYRHDENSGKIHLRSIDSSAVTKLKYKTVVVLAVRSKSHDLYWHYKCVFVTHVCVYFR